MSARQSLYGFGMKGKAHSPDNSGRMSEEIDAFRAEVRAEQGPEDQETLEEAAAMYRALRPVIEATMADSSRWDGDESEEFHLGRYVQWLAAGRAQVRTEVLAEAADVAEMVGNGFLDNAHSGEGNGAMAVAAELRSHADVLAPPVPAAGQDDTGTATLVAAEPITAHWDRLVIHPDPDSDDDTIVCCLADTGHPVALFLDDELREALGMQLVDPDGDGETVAEPERCGVYEGHGEYCDYPAVTGGTHCQYHADQAPPTPADTYAGTRGEPGDVTP